MYFSSSFIYSGQNISTQINKNKTIKNSINMMTAPHFFGNSYPAYHRPSIDSLQARESPLDLQITSKQLNCESQPLPMNPTPSPSASPR